MPPPSAISHVLELCLYVKVRTTHGLVQAEYQPNCKEPSPPSSRIHRPNTGNPYPFPPYTHTKRANSTHSHNRTSKNPTPSTPPSSACSPKNSNPQSSKNACPSSLSETPQFSFSPWVKQTKTYTPFPLNQISAYQNTDPRNKP